MSDFIRQLSNTSGNRDAASPMHDVSHDVSHHGYLKSKVSPAESPDEKEAGTF
jgi:hypothetical protein